MSSPNKIYQVVASILVPNASFLGHLCGILAGLCLVKSLDGGKMSIIASLLRDREIFHVKRMIGYKIFKKFDKDHDLTLSPEELPALYDYLVKSRKVEEKRGGDPKVFPKKITSELIKAIDADGDGVIEMNEFASWFAAQKTKKNN